MRFSLSSMIIVLLTTVSGILLALNCSAWKKVRSLPIPVGSNSFSVDLASNAIYVADKSGKIVAIDAESATVLWTATTHLQHARVRLTKDGLLVYGASRDLLLINTKNGTVLSSDSSNSAYIRSANQQKGLTITENSHGITTVYSSDIKHLNTTISGVNFIKGVELAATINRPNRMAALSDKYNIDLWNKDFKRITTLPSVTDEYAHYFFLGDRFLIGQIEEKKIIYYDTKSAIKRVEEFNKKLLLVCKLSENRFLIVQEGGGITINDLKSDLSTSISEKRNVINESIFRASFIADSKKLLLSYFNTQGEPRTKILDPDQTPVQYCFDEKELLTDDFCQWESSIFIIRNDHIDVWIRIREEKFTGLLTLPLFWVTVVFVIVSFYHFSKRYIRKGI